MRFGLVLIENVDHLGAACFQKIGDERAMTAPPNCFCAHDRRWPDLFGEIDKSLHAHAKFLRLHVIGITAE